MAFEETDDVVTESTVKASTTIQEIRFIRNSNLPSPGLEIQVIKRVIKGGRMRLLTGTVPTAKVVAGWGSTSKTLRAHLAAIITNAEF